VTMVAKITAAAAIIFVSIFASVTTLLHATESSIGAFAAPRSPQRGHPNLRNGYRRAKRHGF
jgi:hypothetical protein